MHCRIELLILGAAFLVTTVPGQQPATNEPVDLQMQLRSATGSNRFRIGEAVPLEFVISSTTPERYLEPCELFSQRSFGFPQCRFFSRWSFTITPEDGWVDLTKNLDGSYATGGPVIEVPNRALTTQLVKFSYLLTSRFRFEKPGEYHVRLTVQIGLDDKTTQRTNNPETAVKPNTVSVSREIVLQIVLPE